MIARIGSKPDTAEAHPHQPHRCPVRGKVVHVYDVNNINMDAIFRFYQERTPSERQFMRGVFDIMDAQQTVVWIGRWPKVYHTDKECPSFPSTAKPYGEQEAINMGKRKCKRCDDGSD